MATTSTPAHINEKLGLAIFIPEVTQGTPNYKFDASGGTGTTATVDTTDGLQHDNNIATAADDFFNKLQIYFDAATTTAALQGKVYDISDFAVAGGTATFTTSASMAASPANGDTFYVLGVMPASDMSVSFAPEDLPRDFVRQTLDLPSAKKGLDKASGSFKFEIPGMVTASVDGTAALEDRWSKFLQCYGSRSAAVGEAVTGAGSTTTQIDVTDATTFAVGDYVLILSQVRRVTAVNTGATPDNITVSPALAAAPPAATVVYQGEVWTPADTGHRSHTLLHYTDDRMVELVGCVFSMKFGGEFGALLMFDVEFDSDGFTVTDAQSLDGSQVNKGPVVFVTSGAMYFGTTALGVNNFEFDAAHGRQEMRDTNAGLRFDIRSREAKCKVVFRDTIKTPKTTWEDAGTQDHLLVFAGNSAGDCVGVAGNAQIESAGSANQNDTRYWDVSYRFVDDQTDAASPSKPKIVRF